MTRGFRRLRDHRRSVASTNRSKDRKARKHYILEQLGHADASITDLADTFCMSLTGIKKHVTVLEQAGLVTTAKVGRVRTCSLGTRHLHEAAAWIEHYRQLWDARFDELDHIVEESSRNTASHASTSRK